MTPSRDGYWQVYFAAVAAALFTVESWALGPNSWMYHYGAGLETIPTHLALLQGDRLLSPWASFVASGVDRFAFWGNADPLNVETLFLAFLPPWLGNGLHRFVQYFIAILFTAKVCEEQLGLDRRQAALGGVLYACFSYFTFGEMLALPALPLFAWLIGGLAVRPSVPWWLPLAAGLGFSALTTFTHSVPYFAVFSVLWTVAVVRATPRRMASVLLPLLGGLALGDTPQLLAALANAPLSHRESFPPEAVTWSLDGLLYRELRFDYFNQDQLAKLLAWKLPLPLLTAGAVLALLMRRSAPGPAATYLRIYAVYLFLSQRWLFVLAQNLAAEWLPWVRGIYMGRFFDLPASFLIACQMTLLVQVLRARLSTVRWAQRGLSATVLLLVAFMLLRPKYFLLYPIGIDGWGQANFRVQSLERLAAEESAPFRVASVLPLQPAYAYAQGLETADGWANLYPRYYRQYWLRVLAPLFRENPAAKEIFDPDSGKPQDHYIFLGADLMHPTVGALPDEIPGAAVEGFDIERRFDLKLLGVLNVKYLLSEFPLAGGGLQLIHAPAERPALAYSRDWATGLLSPPSGPRGNTMRERAKNAWFDFRTAMQRRSQGKDVFIYKLPDFVPRFRLVTTLLFESSGRGVLDRMASMSIADLRSTAILEMEHRNGMAHHQDLGDGSIELVLHEPAHIELKVTVSRESFLVVANSWSPYWTAAVDGHPKALLRANHTQYGLPLRSGTSRVVLAYRPPYLGSRAP